MVEYDPKKGTPTFIAPGQLDQLAAEFSGNDVKSRRGQGGPDLTYISIDATIRRLNEVLGTAWSIDRANTTLEFNEETTNYRAFTELFMAVVIDGTPKTAYGVGAMVNRDPDMAAKSALAEAIKKAGHQLGIALYLWDPEARDRAEKRRKLASASVATLKQEVYALGKIALGKDKPTVAEVAKQFGVKAGDLTDEETLRGILESEGLI